MYAKFLVAMVGVIVMAVNQFAGIDLGIEFPAKFSEVLIIFLTAIGVFATPNKTPQ